MTRRAGPVVSDPLPAPRKRQAIRRRLLAWYDRNARDLPWRRRAGDPYAQWVAEIMLQQTQVETVIPYYHRFLRRFPNVHRLARATSDQLLGQWQGLGYYRRAANLHRAAKVIAANGGIIPDSVEALRQLPGIGAYTAGAIASIAYDQRAAAVDGNVARVLSRLFNITDEVSAPDTQKRLWSIADCLLPARRCGDFNQAWMDLGATVCTPSNPRCDRCPLKNYCAGRLKGNPEFLPRRSVRAPVPEIHYVVAVVRCADAYLMVRRPDDGLWASLWDFPNGCIKQDSDRKGVLRQILRAHGVRSRVSPRAAGTVRHRLTHRLLQFHTHWVNLPGVRPRTPATRRARWVKSTELERVAMSTACRKTLAIVHKVDGANG